MTKIEEILEERGSNYGPFNQHARITQCIKKIMHDALEENERHNQLDSLDQAVVREAVDMIAHKLGRIANGDPLFQDSWDDIAGYAKLVSKHIESTPPF